MGWALRSRSDWLFSLWLGLFSLIPRLYVAIAWVREPVWDGHYYDFGAQRIASGAGYSDEVLVAGKSVWHPWCHYPVGYSGFLAGLYKLFGHGPHVATVGNAVLGALIVVLTHRVARHMLSPARARLAAALCALHPVLILYSGLVMTELLGAFGPLLALWLALVWRQTRPTQGALLSGLALGLTTLVHPQSIVLAPVLAAVATPFEKKPFFRPLLGRTLLVSAVALATVAPWTYRNCRVMDGCAFVSTNGGWNLAIGAFARATGRFETLRASDGCRVVTGQVQQDRCWMKLGIESIRNEPMRWLSLAPKKLSYCFDHQSFAIEYLREASPVLWPEPRRVQWRQYLTGAHSWLLAAAAFAFVARTGRTPKGAAIEIALLSATAGLVAYVFHSDQAPFYLLALAIVALGFLPRKEAPYRGPVGFFIAASLGLFCLTHIAFFGEDRYLVSLMPEICILAAAALRAPKPRAPAAPLG